jgi:formate hydrogenlyase transcriptional activator
VNVRVIASTNLNLAESVAQGQFRRDLFYRLNVFPIRMPPLRERSTDIPILARHFVQEISQRMNKKIEIIPSDVMEALMNSRWPGNVRELEHFIERSIILSEGPVLRAPIAELESQVDSGTGAGDALSSIRRERILKVLRETRGVIAGPHGAAARLGLKRTTLQSIMRRLAITRKDYERY